MGTDVDAGSDVHGDDSMARAGVRARVKALERGARSVTPRSGVVDVGRDGWDVARDGRAWRSTGRWTTATRALARVTEDVRGIRTRLFGANDDDSVGADGGDASATVRSSWARGLGGRCVAVEVEMEARERFARVTRRCRNEIEDVDERRLERARALMQTRRARVDKGSAMSSRARSSGGRLSSPLRVLDEQATLLKRAALEILRRNAERGRALRRAANDMSIIRRGPTLRKAFEGLRQNAEANAPRTRAVLETCETFVAVSARRKRRAVLRAWADAARESGLAKTCAAIHNVRCAQAALRHWELFVARAHWKRCANKLARRYADGRLRVSAFSAWLLHLRRAKERRIAVRARMFGMSVLEAQRAVHEKLDRTAHDASRMKGEELRFLFDERCLRSALRSQIVAAVKFSRALEGLRRFSADDNEVLWASSDVAAVRGIGAAQNHLDAGFRTRGRMHVDARADLSRNREDVAASRVAASIEDADARVPLYETTTTIDVEALGAEAFERSREHEGALAAAREATAKCVSARKFEHETSLRVSRLVANAESRANAATQGAHDAMDEAVQAEYLAMEAEEIADAAEARADALAENKSVDPTEVSAAFASAADAATRAVTMSSAHVAAARVAERAMDIAEEHRCAAELVRNQADEDLESARARVLEAEALVMATAKAERELKLRAMRATAELRRLTGVTSSNEQRDYLVERDENIVFSPTKRRGIDEKKASRRLLTWESFGDGDDEDESIDLRGISLVPGRWVTLAECATQAYAKRLAKKTVHAFVLNVEQQCRRREAALLALAMMVFTEWRDFVRAVTSRRKLVEDIINEVIKEDRERRLRACVLVLRKHAAWRRARCDELKLSLRRIVAPDTTLPAFTHWRTKVANICLVRRVVNRAIEAWKARGSGPSHANAFYRQYDSFVAWRNVVRFERNRRRATRAADQYRRVTLALGVLKSWRAVARDASQARLRSVFDFIHRTSRRRARRLFFGWRAETLRRRIADVALESHQRARTLSALDAWRAVTDARRRSVGRRDAPSS